MQMLLVFNATNISKASQSSSIDRDYRRKALVFFFFYIGRYVKAVAKGRDAMNNKHACLK